MFCNVMPKIFFGTFWFPKTRNLSYTFFYFPGTRCMVDSWLLAHALPPGITTTLHNVTETDEDDEPSEPKISENNGENSGSQNQPTTATSAPVEVKTNRSISGKIKQILLYAPLGDFIEFVNYFSGATGAGGSKNSSGSGTPVRKISAHEFERGGLTKPLVNTVDGAPTFLTPPANAEQPAGQIRKRSRHDMMGLNETDLILELVKDICEDLDIKSLCHKILQNVGILTAADRYNYRIIFLTSNLGLPKSQTWRPNRYITEKHDVTF